MHFLLLGATGRTGRHVVSDLLDQGHTAVALVRNPDGLAARTGLTIVTGSPLSQPDIQKGLAAAGPALKPDAAIVTLNSGRRSDNPFSAQASPAGFLAESCANLCAVLEEAAIRRVVIMSTAGVGDSWDNLPLLSKAFMNWTSVKYALEDHNNVDKNIRKTTQLDWTLVRAVRLVFDDPAKDEPTTVAKDVETLGSSGAGMGMMDSVTVASAARFMVKAAVEGHFVKEAVVIRDRC